MRKLLEKFFLLLFSNILFSQVEALDTLVPNSLNDVVVFNSNSLQKQRGNQLSTIENYLLKSSKIDMIRRGGYAWEPMVNNMASERTLVTIDGMRVFGACTDKMDPITSYIEVSNLSEARIKSGQEGGGHGATIGGSIDLVRKRSGFSALGWNGGLKGGYEFNSRQKIVGAVLNYSGNRFYFDSDFMLRDATNYKAANKQEILYSQFRKFNFSAVGGFALNQNKIIEGSVIYDKANDVGYPALPMDVSLAEAIISSVKYEFSPNSPNIHNWETKIYYNTITHRMDDTKRPSVPIHMDMPGWSDTYGFYSKLNGMLDNHHFKIDLNSFYNKSVADMTMYPSNPNESLMFMYTWPDVRTAYNALFLEDKSILNAHSDLKFTASLSRHLNRVGSQLGLESLQIFYPEMKDSKQRILKSISSTYEYKKNNFNYRFGLAYGERAPSVSEGYGFYLFNSFDVYDYIGNPDLKNEKSIEVNFSADFIKDNIRSSFSSSYFCISDYILGKSDVNLLPMTIGANGVRIYSALEYATIFNSNFKIEYNFSKQLKCMGQLRYSYGKDNQKKNLPLVSPLRYLFALNFDRNAFSSQISLEGNATQNSFNSSYGEDRTPGFAILNFASGYSFDLDKVKLSFNFGLENVFDTYYSTFSDWNNIPRKGRNFFLNFNIGF